MRKLKNNYVIFDKEVDRKTGFARGSLRSILINKMRRINTSTVIITNTTEDLDFYSEVLEKVPEALFLFDEEYAEEHSITPISEWLDFTKRNNDINIL